jgi:hypothetical protein
VASISILILLDWTKAISAPEKKPERMIATIVIVIATEKIIS